MRAVTRFAYIEIHPTGLMFVKLLLEIWNGEVMMGQPTIFRAPMEPEVAVEDFLAGCNKYIAAQGFPPIDENTAAMIDRHAKVARETKE